MNKILVAGATGTTGSAVLADLISLGENVRAMTRHVGSVDQFEKGGIEGVVADFNNAESLNDAFEGVTKLYLVSPASTEMVALEQKVIDAAKVNQLIHIVKLSVIGASPDATFQIGRFHAEVEDYLALSGVPYTILRAHSFMQNLLGSAATVKSQGAIYASLGEAGLPMVDARDIGRAAAKVLKDESDAFLYNTYNLTGPEVISYDRITKELTKQLGRTIQYIPISDEQLKDNLINSGTPDWLAKDLVTMNAMWRGGKYTDVEIDLGELMGLPPRSIQTFIRQHLKYFKTPS